MRRNFQIFNPSRARPSANGIIDAPRVARKGTTTNADSRERPQGDFMVPEPFRDARILIVDDERSMVRLLEELLLGHAGYRQLRSTSDSREVLGLCAECQPDLILLDLRMPTSTASRCCEASSRGGLRPICPCSC
jgi:PleD family two-component response regulator